MAAKILPLVAQVQVLAVMMVMWKVRQQGKMVLGLPCWS
jgi:hypothetical protein